MLRKVFLCRAHPSCTSLHYCLSRTGNCRTAHQCCALSSHEFLPCLLLVRQLITTFDDTTAFLPPPLMYDRLVHDVLHGCREPCSTSEPWVINMACCLAIASSTRWLTMDVSMPNQTRRMSRSFYEACLVDVARLHAMSRLHDLSSAMVIHTATSASRCVNPESVCTALPGVSSLTSTYCLHEHVVLTCNLTLSIN